MKQTITVTDKETGELLEFEWSNASELRAAYMRVKGLEKAIAEAKTKIGQALDEFLGDEQLYEFTDGHKFIRVASATKQYPPEVVRQFLDPDQFELVIDVNGRKLKELLQNLVKENALPDGTWPKIESQAIVNHRAPYIKFQ